MSATVDWMDSRYTVIHANFIDHWDWSELHQALATAHYLMTKSTRNVTLMLDFVGSIKVTSTNRLSSVSEEMQPPANLLRIVIIADNLELAEKMEELLTRLYPHAEEICSAINHEEAFTLVRQTLEMPALKIE